MNRVHKRFLKKIGIGVWSFIKFILVYLAISIPTGGVVWLITGHAEAGFTAGTLLPAFIAMIFFILKDAYNDAKREVDHENRSMMNTLGGKR